MKVEFYLSMILEDEREDNNTIEAVSLKHVSQMSFIPQMGMIVLIGKGEDELSQHEVKEVMWVECDDCLYVTLDIFQTDIEENETYESGWEYFDGLKKRFVENDGWEITEVRGVRA